MDSPTSYDFEILFNNNTVGIIICDSAGNIIEVNDYASGLFGHEPLSMKNLVVEDLIPQKLRHQHENNRARYAESPRTRTMGAEMDLYGLKKDGSVFPLEISLSPFQKDGNHFVTAFIVDVTHRKVNEQKIRKQNEELEEVHIELQKLNSALEQKVSDRTKILQETLMELEASRNELTEALEKEKELGELKSRFVSMASHEFRTPLSTILSSAGLMLRYVHNGDISKIEKHIHRIKSGVEHLNSVLEDFLSLGKIEDGRVNYQPGSCEICKNLDDLRIEMQELAKPNQHIIFEHDGHCNIFTDWHILRNALINLLSNAIKFSEEGKKITIQLQKQQEKIVISIADEGLGIPTEEQHYLFDRFFRASNVSNVQGTGLGLYIVKKYIDMLQGKISFRSIAGKGTTFTISIPYEEDTHH